MHHFQNLPVRHKITAITLMTILVVSLISSTVFVTIESRGARRAMVEELTTIAGIAADSSAAALVFDDPASAEETLAALRAEPNIVWARIYRTNGELFARYPTNDESLEAAGGTADAGHVGLVTAAVEVPTQSRMAEQLLYRDGGLELTTPIVLDGDTIGWMALRSSLAQIATAIGTYIFIALVVVLISLAVAYLLVSRLQAVITSPIEHLLETMEAVSARQDYGIRAKPRGADELGSLIDGFNRMLAEIQRHETGLRAARQQAEEANRAKSEFLANMSHELRTPLNAILGFSEVLMTEIMGPLGSQQYKEYASDINESGRHLLEVINDILDISKIEASRVELVEEEIAPDRLAEKALRLIRERAEQAEVALRLLAQPDLPLLVGDERLVKQAVLNLLSNAVKFTPAGGEVELCLRQEAGGTLAISVRDDGIGIAEADLARVLVPFGQVESTLSRNYQGTGLGLPLAKSFVELHGGELEIRSAPDEGTEVTLRFPKSRVRACPPKAAIKGALSA
jgi:signal transduction histidine kinase